MATLHSFANNAIGTIQNNPLASVGTNLIVNNALDTILQAIPQFYWLTLWHIGVTPDTDSQMEIVLVTARVSPNNYTITRAQQGTSAQNFVTNSNVGLLWTAGNAAEVIDYTDTVGKGYIIIYNSSGKPILLAPGSNGLSLVANSSATLGVNWAMPPNPSVFGSGTSTYNAGAASATQTIAHGLGVVPKFVTIKMGFSPLTSSSSFYWAKSVYNGTTQSSQSLYDISNDQLDNSFTIGNSGQATTGVITFDVTNIYIAWTRGGTSTTAIYQQLWTATG